MRRLLPGLPALRFQHLMRVVCHEILHHIQDDHPTRQAWMLASHSRPHQSRHHCTTFVPIGQQICNHRPLLQAHPPLHLASIMADRGCRHLD